MGHIFQEKGYSQDHHYINLRTFQKSWDFSYLQMQISIAKFLEPATQQAIAEHHEAKKARLENRMKQIREKLQEETKSLISKKYKKKGHMAETITQQYRIFMVASKNTLTNFQKLILNEDYLKLAPIQEVEKKIEAFGKVQFRNLGELNRLMSAHNPDIHEKYIKKMTSLGKRERNCKSSPKSLQCMEIWILKNFENPYPTSQEKEKMVAKSNLTLFQVNNWLINVRERVIKKILKKELHTYSRVSIQREISDSKLINLDQSQI